MPNVDNLKLYRTKTNASQEDFANVLGCCKANYCYKEQGKTAITLEEAEKLAMHISNELGTEVTVQEIFFNQKISL